MTIRAYAALAKGAALTPHSYELAPLAEGDVEVAVASCSLCHSDLHLIDDDWGISRFPLVPGHEVVGRVVATGAAVRSVKTGDLVGIGWQRSSCGTCEACTGGFANLCQVAKRRTCVDQPGGFAERVRASESFVFAIPAALDPRAAAPLLCAGVTVFAPLERHLAGRKKRVAVLGLGGLGHLAVQFAHKMGCEVTVFDPVVAKATEARKLGATALHDVAEIGALAKGGARYDLILSTTHANLAWDQWLGALALNGTLCLAGVPSKPLQFASDHLIDGQKVVTGSAIGSPEEMRAMLGFSAKHGVEAMVEHLPMARVNEGLDRIRRGEARYRVVLHADFDA